MREKSFLTDDERHAEQHVWHSYHDVFLVDFIRSRLSREEFDLVCKKAKEHADEMVLEGRKQRAEGLGLDVLPEMEDPYSATLKKFNEELLALVGKMENSFAKNAGHLERTEKMITKLIDESIARSAKTLDEAEKAAKMPYMVAWQDTNYEMTASGLCRDEKTAREVYEKILQSKDVTEVFLCRVVDGPKDTIDDAMQSEKVLGEQIKKSIKRDIHHRDGSKETREFMVQTEADVDKKAKKEVRYDEPVLCYIDGPWAYFTTRQLDLQWGDDWDDAPYEHNAGEPYGWIPQYKEEPWKIIRVAFDGNLLRPCDGSVNSSFSVRDINSGKVPWLRLNWSTESKDCGAECVWAGATLREFAKAVEAHGGTVYLKLTVDLEKEE